MISFAPRRAALFGLLGALLIGAPAPLAAQYFGRNKVQYEKFDFRIMRTSHFDMYFYPAESLVVHDGVRNLLRQPEFAESSRLHQVLEVLEETRYLTLLLRQLIGESDLQIVIGSENASSQLQGCAVVLTTYGPSNRLKGVLGVIGPTRMAYSQTVARLQAVARSASERMADLGV